jgi:hypothetical protein
MPHVCTDIGTTNLKYLYKLLSANGSVRDKARIGHDIYEHTCIKLALKLNEMLTSMNIEKSVCSLLEHMNAMFRSESESKALIRGIML